MCLICGSRSVPAGRDGRGSGLGARPPARQVRRCTSTCSSRFHTIAPPSGLIVAISSHAASEHGIDRYRGRHEAPRAHSQRPPQRPPGPRAAAWIDEYNTTRRHSATGMISPAGRCSAGRRSSVTCPRRVRVSGRCRCGQRGGGTAPPAWLTPRHPSPSQRPQAPGLGQSLRNLSPQTTQARAPAGPRSRRCSSTTRAPLCSWRRVS